MGCAGSSPDATAWRARARAWAAEVGPPAASSAVISHGAVVRIDGGADDEGYKTDIQRLAYVLRPGEKEAPFEVQKAFDTVKAANRAAATAAWP